MQTTLAVLLTTCIASTGGLAPSADRPDPGAVSALPDIARLREMHTLLASEPHVAGSEGDARTIARIAQQLRTMGKGVDGFEVEVQDFFPLLARPLSASLRIVGEPSGFPVNEPALAIDPDTAHGALDIAWNAWSGSGAVEAGVVYVNYGRREDFARLAELGIDPRGKIALARYGGNYRGFKVKFAEEAGCVGLVIFTDPADSGEKRGKTWPDGGWAHPRSVQRGSVITLGYSGDPLTPGRMATKDAERLDPSSLALPRIPVHPIGSEQAARIVSRMKGAASPGDWRGGIDAAYALDDPDLRLQLEVRQVREVRRTANVIARLRGATLPDEEVIVGSHHDAWCAGAADPLAGTICTLEAARVFCDLARRGVRADRTLVFCAWGAEEFGIFGSTEFVEEDAAALGRRAVAYLNLDMSAMGLRPGASASPSLRAAITRAMQAARGPLGQGTAFDAWSKGDDGAPGYGDLGGGSDHLPFWCHAGVPAIALSSGGVQGVSYHSNYDTLAWYRANVGDDYRAAEFVSGMAAALLAELADARRPVASARQFLADALGKARGASELARVRGVEVPELEEIQRLLADHAGAAAALDERFSGDRGAEHSRVFDTAVRRIWFTEQGLEGRPWFRNLIAASDRNSGYGTTPWPLLTEAIEDAVAGDTASTARLREAAGRYLKVVRGLCELLDASSARSDAAAP
jgi:N-acetylated-alpha-linked acidic dipeptidase